ncbi:MAG: hypothetical protein FJ004_06820 [Chloroflexi bacterium]|nr:hypothetical protein [Chloroflexota bacterium]
MTTDSYYRMASQLGSREAMPLTQFRQISQCLVRKDHPCGKFLGASKSCFIACPSSEDIEPILALIGEKLSKIGIEPVIAIKERAYGQDIFCIKICGKIIESQFCIVILDDTIKRLDKNTEIGIPNPNVYYEYGLMTALGKHIIPLQKSEQQLAFNIQTHDTIKYMPKNISAELDRALKDANTMTKEGMEEDRYARNTERLVRRSLEIAGYVNRERDYDWFLYGDLRDTLFSGYSNPEKKHFLFISIANSSDQLSDCLTDIQVIIKRLETRHNSLAYQITSLEADIEKREKELLENEGDTEGKTRRVDNILIKNRLNESVVRAKEKRNEALGKYEPLHNSKFGIVLLPQVTGFKAKVMEKYNSMDRIVLNLPLYVGDTSGIQIDDLSIPFERPKL